MKKWFALAALGAVMFAVLVPATAEAQYRPSFMTMSATAAAEGDGFSVEAGSFDPGSVVTVTFMSTPVNLGSLVVPESGVVRGSFTVPNGVGTGPHTVQLSGTSGGESLVLSSALEVVGRSQPVTPAAATVTPVVATPEFTG